MLGFRVAGKFPGKGGHNVYFLENPSDGKMYEISQRDQLPGGATTRVDHIAYRSEELEKDYTYCKEHGYKILSDEIEVRVSASGDSSPSSIERRQTTGFPAAAGSSGRVHAVVPASSSPHPASRSASSDKRKTELYFIFFDFQ